jgi:hypothetical protein
MKSKNYLILFSIVIQFCLFVSCKEDPIQENELSGKSFCQLTKSETYNNGILFGIHEYKYNANDLVEKIIYKFYSNESVIAGEATVEFDDKKRVKKITKNTNNFIDISYSNDNSMMYVKRTSEVQSLGGDFTLLIDEFGRILSLAGNIQNEYNQLGQLTKIYAFSPPYSNNKYLREERTYDDKKNPLEKIPVDVVIYNATSVFFDLGEIGTPNNITQRKTYNSSGTLLNTQNYTFEYNSLGYPTKSNSSSTETRFFYTCK